ncbi:S-layer homology domain-containing protein, partial [Clostridiaceae bacterium HSG29]|nr:S-layer homology domain-containing protein [Clostridiaceae bacterium HSG29]
DVYDIKVINSDLNVKLQKPMKLCFNFYGSTKAGIYKFVNKQWMYLQTEFDDGVIYTEIPAVDFNGGKFAILIDNDYRPLKNSMLHWAYDDFQVYLKRGYIKNDSEFNPDAYMTRKEFSRMIRRNTDGMIDYSYSSPIDFIDKDLFLEYANDVNFMVSKGYMNGVSSNAFNPNGYITYNQVEIVMNRIMDEEFSWDDISDLMLIERFNKSNVNEYKSNYINNAEVIYMLNHVLGSKVLFEK